MSLLVGETAVSVKLRDDGFQRQLVSMVDAAVRSANGALERLGSTVRPVVLNIDDQAARAMMEALSKPIDTTVLPTVDDAAAKAILDQFGNPIETVIQPLVDGARARAEIGDLTRAWDATMTVVVDDAAARAARADLERPIEPTFSPQPDGGAQTAQAEGGGGGGGAGLGALGGLATLSPGAAGGLLTVAGLAALTKAGADYQTVLTQIRTAATALPEDAAKNSAALGQLREVVTALGNDMELPGQSAKDAADAINVLVRANYPLADAEALARNALQLSIVTKMQAADATTLLTDVMATSGLQAKDATFAIDRLAMSEILGKGKVADLAESVKYSGTSFKALYGETMGAREGFEQMLGTLLVFDQAGVRGSLAGTELNRMMADFATPTGKADTALGELTKRLASTNAEMLKGGTITRDAAGNMRPVADIINNMEAATKGLGKAQKDEYLNNVLTTNGLRAYQVVVGQGTDKIAEFAAKVHQADGAGKKLAEGSASDLSKSIENLGSTMETVSNNLVDTLSPGITAGLTAMADGIGLAGNAMNDGLKGLLDGGAGGALDTVKSKLSNIITPEVAAKAQQILGQLEGMFRSGFEAVRAVVETVVKVIEDLWDRFGNTLLDGLGNALDAIVQVVQGGLTLVKGVFDIITAVLHGDWSALWDGIKEVVRGAWSIINGVVDAGWNILRTAFGVALGLISAAWSTAWHALHTLLVDVWEGVKKAVSSGIDTVVGFLKALPGKAVSAVGSVATTLLSAGKSLIEGFFNGIQELWKTVSTWLGNMASRILGAVPSMASVLLGAGKGLIQGLYNGALEVWGGFYTWLKSLPGKVRDAISSIPGIVSDTLSNVPGAGLVKKGWNAVRNAEGGFYDRATFGLFGEDGPEVILPLSKPDRLRELLALPQVSSALGALSGPGTTSTVDTSATGGALRIELDTSWVDRIVTALERLTNELTSALKQAISSTAKSVDQFTYEVGAGLEDTAKAVVGSVDQFTYKIGAGLDQKIVADTTAMAAFTYQVGKGLDEVTNTVRQFTYKIGAGAYADGAVVDRPTFGLFGEAGPEAILPLSRPDRMRTILADKRVFAAVAAAQGNRDVVNELRSLRAGVGALQPSQTYVSVPDPAFVHIYARAQADALTRRLRKTGV